MTRKCVVCNKLYSKGSEESFHSFPKDEVRRKIWLKACKIKLCLPSNKICGDHFLPKYFLPSGYLNKNAVPSLTSTITDTEPSDYHSTSSPCPSPIECSWIEPKIEPKAEPIASTSTDIDYLDHSMVTSTINSSPCQSPLQRKRILNPTTIGVLSPSHFSSPREAKRHLDMVKYKFKEKQVQNTNLKKQIKRLKKKVEQDHNYIQSLKKLLENKKCKKILNVNTVGVLSPNHINFVRKSKKHLDMTMYKFKEKKVQNKNLKNQIKILKNTVEQDHNYRLKNIVEQDHDYI